MVSLPESLHDRACDQCWIRKIKCNRSLRCRTCSRLCLDCSYVRPRKKKGPSGNRIGLIRQLPENVVNFARLPRAESVKSPSSLMLSPSPLLSCLSPSNVDMSLVGAEITTPASEIVFPSELFDSLCTDFTASSLLVGYDDDLAQYVPTSINVDIQTMNSLIESYICHMSKYYPLVDTASLSVRLRAGVHTHNFEFGALVLSICAYVLLQPVFKRDDALQDKPAVRERTKLAETLMDKAIAMRNMNPAFTERPSVDNILTSFFLCACFINRQLPHAAWSRLCEAVTLAEIMEVQSLEDNIVTVNEREQRATLYRILAVTEPAFAVQYRYALSGNLLSRIDKSKFYGLDPGPLGAMCGLTTLVSLYSVVSTDMLDCWNNQCGANSAAGCPMITTERVLDMHQFMSDVYDGASTPTGDNLFTDAQRADIMISRLWLHNRLWNVCHAHGLVNERNDIEGCRESRLSYPFDIARQTIEISKSFTIECIEVHGFSIVGKLYDIASSVVMVLSCYPSWGKTRIEESQLVPSDTEVLNQYISLLATFGGGQHPYLAPFMTAITGLPPMFF
ncbi:hypothetical protein POJ06DRAFT_224229 [Lipomyces tetrasporus]|uniref:Zn(2)-C6 fungal-type domain-containing protein n=1 Tax=Lipomyces tetrasporus TaxID=54092 RepID=A0AAD7QRC5_9ASCO|nr:uncharacterized protein POJ06DRAFT_224229 [Lipomyces tetrasporus]KAJ8100137.1 hypothetical protein POJ06DRAFT_224229 [Lipomyces tetrasporus]